MEPFGLFQFLQSLLNSPTDSGTTSTEETAQTAEPPLNTTGKQPCAAENKNNEAYLRFISDHEKRARNTKKK